ncbi:27578_t:CDS:2 [Dentiscutata erythropus]|uniref:27578_t:CDS:1 n=1 Tax=Dentiscutata erythropus TaxID=1348616 RepID=A0A9N9GJ04_9GLOM|nr:27578_t:CDS:2 [Dentiscutata erythropus]
MEENGFLPTLHFRSKNSLPELPDHTFSCSANRKSRPYSSDWQQISKNQHYGKYSTWNKNTIQNEEYTQEYERPAKRLSLSNSTASKWRQNVEDNGIGNSNLSDNNQKGPFQRSMNNILPQPGDRGSFKRSMAGSLFGMRSVEHLNPTPNEFNTLKNVQAETRRRSDLMVKIAGPIEFLPTDYKHNDIRTLTARSELAKFDDITLNNVMNRYRNSISSGSKPSEPPKNIEITKEEWVAMMRTLDLSEDYNQNTMKILQQWQDIKIKVPITVGKIIKLDSNKKVATIADYTGKIQAIIHENVLRVHGQKFQIDTILVLKNVSILRSIGNTYLNVTLTNLHLTSAPQQSNHLESTLPSVVSLTNRPIEEGIDSNSGNSGNQTSDSHLGNSDKNDMTINKESSEGSTSTQINESRMKIRPMSDEDQENNNFMLSNGEDSEDISWMLDGLEEVISVDY